MGRIGDALVKGTLKPFEIVLGLELVVTSLLVIWFNMTGAQVLGWLFATKTEEVLFMLMSQFLAVWAVRLYINFSLLIEYTIFPYGEVGLFAVTLFMGVGFGLFSREQTVAETLGWVKAWVFLVGALLIGLFIFARRQRRGQSSSAVQTA